MASTYTSNTGIEKPATGEQSGTWGDTTNTNFDIIDRSLNGVGTIDLSASGAAHTLTTSDGTLTDGMYRVLVLDGATEACTITISPNDQQKFYAVKNGSGYTATFTQGSGGNVTIEDGSTKFIYSDGAGASAQVVDISGTIEASGVINATTLKINGTTVTSTAAELNILDGCTATFSELNILDGCTSTTAELNLLDGSTAGTVVNSKAVVYGASGEVGITTADFGDWTVTETAGDLIFSHSGTAKMKLDSSGNLTITGVMTSVGTIT